MRSRTWDDGEVICQAVWVPETECTSRDLLILVEQSAEPVAPPDVVNLGCCALGERSQGSGLAESAVRPVTVFIRGRGLRRYSTASWWRRTRISISLAVSDRVRSTIQLRSLENTR